MVELTTKHLVQYVEVSENHFKTNIRPEIEWMNDEDFNKPSSLENRGGCQLPPVIEPKRKRKRKPMK